MDWTLVRCVARRPGSYGEHRAGSPRNHPAARKPSFATRTRRSMNHPKTPPASSATEVFDARLLGRLLRPLTRPALVRLDLVRRILGDVDRMQQRLALATLLARR